MSNGAWTWELSERAADGLRALDDTTQQRLLEKFDPVIADDFRDPPAFARPLTGAKPWQSLRVGDYRAIVRFHHDERVMQVGAIGHRSSIYDEFPLNATGRCRSNGGLSASLATARPRTPAARR